MWFIKNRMYLPTMTIKLKGCAGDPYREIGDRITVSDSEISLSSTDFFVTGINWTYSSRGYIQEIEAVRCTDLYPHLGETPTYFIIGTNKLGSADALRGRCFF
jgi:hypothetical protein